MMSDPDPLSIPVDWPDARPYLERVLEERRDRLEAKIGRIEYDVHSLRAEMVSEINQVREGVAHIEQSFRGIVAQSESLIEFTRQLHSKQESRLTESAERQCRIDENLQLIAVLESKDDKNRFAWRLGTLIAIFLLALLISLS